VLGIDTGYNSAMAQGLEGLVESVHSISSYTFSKHGQPSLRLLKGLAAEGDAHMGVTVKHRSRLAQDPTQLNLRQIYLVHAELHGELDSKGFRVKAGDTGKKITTCGLNRLPVYRRMKTLGATAPSRVLSDRVKGSSTLAMGTSGQGSSPASGFGSGARDRPLPHESLR
jgi:hypothetical protein